jgi:hypothetical protein
MAFNGRFVSIKGVVESVYRDAEVDEVNMETAMADTLELIGLLGIPYNYVEMSTDGVDAPITEVSNFRAYMPSDAESLISMRKVTLDQNLAIMQSEEMIETGDLFHNIQQVSTQDLSYVQPTARAVGFSQAEDGTLVTEDMVIVGPKSVGYQLNPYCYRINNGVIFTNFDKGYICIKYRTYPTDDNGWLMVPDDEKYKTALKFHLIYKLDYRRWRRWPEKGGYKALLNDSEQQRDFYVSAARNKAHIPTIDKMEAIKNNWLRSMPRINEHRNGFKTLNNGERRKF